MKVLIPFIIIISIILFKLIEKYGEEYKQETDNTKWNKNRNSLGGCVIYFLLLIGLLVNQFSVYYVAAISTLFLIGLADDINYSSSMELRFFVQCLCTFVVLQSEQIPMHYFPFIVAMINAFNFIDNMDGILATVCFWISILLFCSLSSNFYLLVIPIVVFFYFNKIKKTLFIGDCGSTVLGFFFSTFVLMNACGNIKVLIIFFLFPILDISFVVIRRLIEKRKPWIGGTDHIAHCLSRKFSEEHAYYIINAIVGGFYIFWLTLGKRFI